MANTSNNDFHISLVAKNIGPHKDFNLCEKVNSNKIVFYANNGTGKTFLSRTFRLAEEPKKNADDLITVHKKEAEFSFKIVNDNLTKELSVKLNRGNEPIVNNNSGLIFHVFNSDYVNEQIVPNNYTPDGEIDGYIIGKEQIDLSEEKNKEETLRGIIKKYDERIDKYIDSLRKKLTDEGVHGRTTEMSLITREELHRGKIYDDVRTSEQVTCELEKLAQMPEELQDISLPVWSYERSCLDDILIELSVSHSKSEWDEEFVKYYNDNREFITKGLDNPLLEKEVCPFCKRELESDALELVKMYSAYREDKESKIVDMFNRYKKALDDLFNAIKNWCHQTSSAQTRFEKFKEYFPSLKSIQITNIEIDEYQQQPFDSLKEAINNKIKDLTLSLDEKDNINLIKTLLRTITNLHKDNLDFIIKANHVKNNINTERLGLRRDLCRSIYMEGKSKLAEAFACFNKAQEELKKIQKSIKEKEEKIKISKKEKVSNALNSLLKLFFGDKYSLDTNNFHIKFWGDDVGEVSKILSDGEKSIVAYCYYIASTYKIVDSEDDFERLFFIIDDPVSSMDLQYVYLVSETLRGLRQSFGINGHERIWVFTHSIDFFNMLRRNTVFSVGYEMHGGTVKRITENIALPYEYHLLDVLKVAEGIIGPAHTNANSIRHIIETISSFECPGISLQKYIENDEDLSKERSLCTICQDLSHGWMRTEMPFTEAMIISACKTLVTFMEKKYKGQIDTIRKRLS